MSSKYNYERALKKEDKKDKAVFTAGKFVVVAAAAAAAGAFTYSLITNNGDGGDGGCDTAEQSALRTRNF